MVKVFFYCFLIFYVLFNFLRAYLNHYRDKIKCLWHRDMNLTEIKIFIGVKLRLSNVIYFMNIPKT